MMLPPLLTSPRPLNVHGMIKLLPFEETADVRLFEVALWFKEMETVIASKKRLVSFKETSRVSEDQSSRLKSEFLALISHELRTPLNGILGTLELLKSTDMSGEQGKLVETIQRSSTKLLDVVSDIIDYSKLQSNSLVAEHYPFSIKNCIDDVLNYFKPELDEKKDVHFDQEIPLLPERCYGDETKLKRILVHVIGNAIKFTSVGSLKLRIEVEPDSNQHVLVLFTISDTGTGMKNSPFKVFNLGDSGISREHDGMGLGLVLSKKFAEIMGGFLRIVSKEKEGTTVQFAVQIQQITSEDKRGDYFVSNSISQPSSPSTSSGTDEWKQLGFGFGTSTMTPTLKSLSMKPNTSISILIVDDNKINQKLAEKLVKKLNTLAPDLAADGLQAIQAVQKKVYHLILMDIAMPNMDGVEATKMIRTLLPECYGGLPPFICALTANTCDEERQKCMEAGMDAFVAKPFQVSDLEHVIQAASEKVIKQDLYPSLSPPLP